MQAGGRPAEERRLQYAARPLVPGAIRPRGWFRAQLETQAEGLTGHLDEFWPDVKESGWFGGSHEGWERAPYWLDGLVPLAFGLGDERLMAKAHHYVGHIVDHQRDDGWIGPEQQSQDGHAASSRDPWPVFVALKALTQYADATGDGRVADAIRRAVECIGRIIDRKPLFEWGKYRYQDLLLSLFWLYDRTGDPALLLLAERVHNQGYNWEHHFSSFIHTGRSAGWQFDTHVVSNAQALKAPAVWALLHPEEFADGTLFAPVQVLDRFHGQSTGIFSGDECLAGLMPSQGTELCAVVEYMYSLECMASAVLDPRIGDRLERIAYNALPATFTADMWAHQYVQQANQAQCTVTQDRIYTTNDPDANIYGLEPNYGCCTANMHQGYPKLLRHLWLAERDGGLAALAYAPCHVSVPGSDASLEVRTGYPFAEDIEIALEARGRLPLSLRIPEWASGATASMELPGRRRRLSARPGTYLRVDEVWNGDAIIRLHFPMKIRTGKRYNDAISVERGPIVYALQVSESYRRVGGEDPHSDWEALPASAWNRAIRIDPDQPERYLTLQESPMPQDASPFAPARHAGAVEGPGTVADARPATATARDAGRADGVGQAADSSNRPPEATSEATPGVQVPPSGTGSASGSGHADGVGPSVGAGVVPGRPIVPARFRRPPAPLALTARSVVIPGWKIEHGAASAPPPSPLKLQPEAAEEEPCTLVPYGCTNLRITEIPWYGPDHT